MDKLDKRIINGLEEMEKRMGRMLRNMSLPGMSSLQSGVWTPAVDVYETEAEIIVYVDTAGIDPDKLTVTAERNGVTISGYRDTPDQGGIRCIHQLEIEQGRFKRHVSFPVSIDVAAVKSNCRNGILEVRMPKEGPKGKIKIKVG